MSNTSSTTKTKKSTVLTLDKLLEAKTLQISGIPLQEIAEELNTSPSSITTRLKKLDRFLTEESNNKIIQSDQKAVKDVLQAKLDVIKASMTNDSIKIISDADSIVKKRLSVKDPDSSTKDIALISRQYAERLSGLTGLEELASKDDYEKTTNIYVQNIFNRFKDSNDNQQSVDNSIS